jgi:hypothetical protein
MKTTLTFLFLFWVMTTGVSQSIVGTWQLVKQTTCMDDNTELSADGVEEVLEDMKKMSGPSAQVLRLKDNNTGDESTKIISKKKSYNSNAFLYKYNGSSLYFLDKKSKTIIEGFTVEKLHADSLIISNSARACETKIFVKLK